MDRYDFDNYLAQLTTKINSSFTLSSKNVNYFKATVDS